MLPKMATVTLSKDDIANDNFVNMSQSAQFQSLETCKMYQDADGSIDDDKSNGNFAIVMSFWLLIHLWQIY